MAWPAASLDSGSMRQTRAVTIRRSPRSRPLVRFRGWRPLAWVTLTAGVVLTVVVEVVGGSIIGLRYMTTCNELPSATSMESGQHALLLLLAACTLPWVVATALIRSRVRVAVAALVALSPLVYTWVIGFSARAWVGGFCF